MADDSGFGRTVEPELIHRGPSQIVPDWCWKILAERIQHLRELLLRELAVRDRELILQADRYEEHLKRLNNSHERHELYVQTLVLKTEHKRFLEEHYEFVQEIEQRIVKLEEFRETVREETMKTLEATRLDTMTAIETTRSSMMKWATYASLLAVAVNIIIQFMRG